MLLSFVFGKENPRSGREGSLVTGVLIYIFYLSILVAFRESYSSELNAFYYFLWPVHFMFLFFSWIFFWLDGRLVAKNIILHARVKTISIIFLIFALIAWLSSWFQIFILLTQSTWSKSRKGPWIQIELYLRDHTEAEFRPGIFPECAKKRYPDINPLTT